MKSWIIIPAIVVLAGLYLFFFLHPVSLISPDELSYLFFSEHFARTGSFFYRSPGDQIMGEQGFIPRKFHYTAAGEIVSRKPPGLIIVYGLFQRLLPGRWSRSFFPIMALVVLYLFYRFTACFFPDARHRLAAVLLLASMPLFLLRSNACSPAMLNLAVFILSLLCLDGVLNKGNWYHYAGLGVAAALLIWVRQTSVLLWIPLGFIILRDRKRLIKNRLLWTGAGFIVLLGAYFFYNHFIYGNFFAVSYTVQFSRAGTGGTGESIKNFFRIVQMHPQVWLLHVLSIPITFSIAFPPLILGVIGYCLAWKEKPVRRWILLSGTTFAVLIVFFANFETYGFSSGEINLRSSFLRYCLPAIVFGPIGAVFFLSKLGRLFERSLAILVIFNIIIALTAPMGLMDSLYLGHYYSRVKEFILDNTDDRSVILSNYWDKMAFPERMVFSSLSGMGKKQWDSLLSLISKKGYRPVYIEYRRDQADFKALRENYRWDRVEGPEILKGVMKKMKPPGDIYPVTIFTYRGPVTGVIPAKPKKPMDNPG
ncbi:MAG: glycosyltransferase family 39 protein [PVC group bacterium]